jgi:2-phospho-L-lactate guanylyltransferase (CobY/MobA/RfbA family)
MHYPIASWTVRWYSIVDGRDRRRFTMEMLTIALMATLLLALYITPVVTPDEAVRVENEATQE